MENQKVRIYWREFDEDGNVINRGVDDREYVNAGWAYNRAMKLFGPRYSNKRFQYRIAWRDPWEKYTCEVECRVCGQTFVCEESEWTSGRPMDADCVHMYLRSCAMKDLTDGARYPKYDGYCCPDCARKIHNFICSLRKGE